METSYCLTVVIETAARLFAVLMVNRQMFTNAFIELACPAEM